MHQPLIVTVDSAKGIARMSGPLTLGNTYKVGWSGLTDEEAAATPQPQLVILGIPQLTDEWESGNPETRVAAMTDDEDVLALNTAELVDAFKAAPPSPMPPVPPRDPRRPARPMGVALHGTARPHGAIPLHFYVTAGGETLAQGDCTLLWAPFEFDGTGTPVVLQGPKGDKGDQGETGPQGERGADAAVVRVDGCVTFAVDHDESSDTYGHLFAYSDDADALYHHGDMSKPHWWIGTGSNGGTAGHLYYTYYPADPATAATVLDLGAVIPEDSGAAFAARLKSELESNVGELSAINLNTAIALGNAIKNALFGVTHTATALLLAFVLPFFFGEIAFCTEYPGDEYLVAGWTMATNFSGEIVNIVPDGGAGDLTLHEGVKIDEYGETNIIRMGKSLCIDGSLWCMDNYNAVASSADTYDPLGGAAAFTIAAWYLPGEACNQTSESHTIFSDVRTANGIVSGVELIHYCYTQAGLPLWAPRLIINGRKFPDDGWPEWINAHEIPPFESPWIHIAAVYDGTKLDLYWNGINCLSFSAPGLTVGANDSAVVLGNTSVSEERNRNTSFIGCIDNVMIYRGWAATKSDIEKIMYRTFIEPDIGASETLGEMNPTNTLYTAPQIDGMIKTLARRSETTSSIETVSSRVDAIESDYVQAADISDFATNGDVASVERRNDWTECTLYWGTNTLQNGRYYIPTNFPTRSLKIIISSGTVTNLSVRLPAWEPKNERTIRLFIFLPEIDETRSFRLEAGAGSAVLSYNGMTAVSRIETMEWDGVRWTEYGQTYTGYSIMPDGRRQTKDWTPDNAPVTVNDWLALHPEWADTSAQSPSIFHSVLRPPAVSNLAEPDWFEALDDLHVDEPEEFDSEAEAQDADQTMTTDHPLNEQAFVSAQEALGITDEEPETILDRNEK